MYKKDSFTKKPQNKQPEIHKNSKSVKKLPEIRLLKAKGDTERLVDIDHTLIVLPVKPFPSKSGIVFTVQS